MNDKETDYIRETLLEISFNTLYKFTIINKKITTVICLVLFLLFETFVEYAIIMMHAKTESLSR